MTYWINDDTRLFLSRGVIEEGISVEQRLEQMFEAARGYIDVDKFREYTHAGFYSFASPEWANFGNGRGLPISCNGVFIDDTVDDILGKIAEIGKQTKEGAGTSAYIGHIRPSGSPISVGGVADGPVFYAALIDQTVNRISQGSVRRGSCAIYMDVDHPDIMDFLEIREEGHEIQNLSLGVCISDQWMIDMLAGDKAKLKIWMRILRKRSETGYPYIFWTDAVNRNSPFPVKIWASNLCTEITIPSSVFESFVCCLMSMNIDKYDEWKNTDAVEQAIRFLNAVLDEYIRKIKNMPFMANSVQSAEKYRAIGLGTLGWHTYLQSKSIPYESDEALRLNVEIHKLVGDRSRVEGKVWGNYVTNAIAPTTSSSFILGQVSPSIEPLNSNYFVKDLAKGKFTYRNPNLKNVLFTYGKDDEETWLSILSNGGSVQHLDFLSDQEKAVYKTFGEINQAYVVLQAAHRVPHIDQAQSLNIMVHPNTSPKDLHELHVMAWRLGNKTMYYQRSTNPAQEFARELLNCEACSA